MNDLFRLNKILSGVLLALISVASLKCKEAEVSRETRAESYAPPTIQIVSGVENGIMGGVAGSNAGIVLEVASDWGLSSLLMNDVEVASLPIGQLKAQLSYSIPIPNDAVIGEPFKEVKFTIVDEDGQRTSTPFLSVQRNPLPESFILSSLSGDEISRDNIMLPEQGSTSPRVKLGVGSNLGIDYSYIHLVFNDNRFNDYLDFGTGPATAPDETGIAWIRKPAGIPIKAFNSLLIDLDSYIPQELITEVLNGERSIKLDVYYENPGADEPGAFPAILNLSNKSMYNRASWAGVLLEYTDTLTVSNEWQTLVFNRTYAANNADKNTVADPAEDELDLIDFIIGRGYTNPDNAKYFIRNLRVEK